MISVSKEKSNNNLLKNKDTQKELQKIQKRFQQLEEKLKISTKKKSPWSRILLYRKFILIQKILNAENYYNQKNIGIKKANVEYETLFEKNNGNGKRGGFKIN